MPTYACWATTGTIPVESRKRIVDALTEIHHEAALAPRYLVQVVFNDLAAGSVFVAGQAADPAHVWIRADIRSGRTDEQKREMLERITTDVGEIVGVSPEEVWVYLNDIPGASMAEFGRRLPNPGEEEQWFTTLPAELQQRLRPLR